MALVSLPASKQQTSALSPSTHTSPGVLLMFASSIVASVGLHVSTVFEHQLLDSCGSCFSAASRHISYH